MDVEITPRGASISGNPVGGALDGPSPDGKIAVETSVRQDYFTGDLRKPRADLAHVLTLAAQVEQIRGNYVPRCRKSILGRLRVARVAGVGGNSFSGSIPEATLGRNFGDDRPPR
ncbi:hypothetical protein [Sinorhizobium meliloti]|uniref:hypothetical protein n=1 Tax=Rhizobium meliloti TaxID=382 RepID=UPI0030CA8534